MADTGDDVIEMSEGGGHELKNGAMGAVSRDGQKRPDPSTFDNLPGPYDENGLPRPFICICPPKLCDLEPTQNGSGDGRSKGESGTNKSKEGGQIKYNNSDASGSLSKGDDKNLNKSFSEQFKLFSKFGDTKSDGRLLSLSQSDKWMKQAKVIDGKHITTTDTGIHFKKLKSLKVSETDYKKFLDDLAKTKKMNIENLKKKMVSCGAPGLSTQSGGAKAPSAFERLTDTSKYTGSHKLRFDEAGKGRGIAGRKDLPDSSGYVSGYMNKNTYDKKNPTK